MLCDMQCMLQVYHQSRLSVALQQLPYLDRCGQRTFVCLLHGHLFLQSTSKYLHTPSIQCRDIMELLHQRLLARVDTYPIEGISCINDCPRDVRAYDARRANDEDIAGRLGTVRGRHGRRRTRLGKDQNRATKDQAARQGSCPVSITDAQSVGCTFGGRTTLNGRNWTRLDVGNSRVLTVDGGLRVVLAGYDRYREGTPMSLKPWTKRLCVYWQFVYGYRVPMRRWCTRAAVWGEVGL